METEYVILITVSRYGDFSLIDDIRSDKYYWIAQASIYALPMILIVNSLLRTRNAKEPSELRVLLLISTIVPYIFGLMLGTVVYCMHTWQIWV